MRQSLTLGIPSQRLGTRYEVSLYLLSPMRQSLTLGIPSQRLGTRYEVNLCLSKLDLSAHNDD